MDPRELDLWHMRRALELAAPGQGFVEPNPMVGCVIARGAEIIGEGWHRRFGGDHAEVEALRLAGSRAAGATLVRHAGAVLPHGQDAALHARRSWPPASAASWPPWRDPFPQVAGGGTAALQAAGVAVEVGLLAGRGPATQRPLSETAPTAAGPGSSPNGP